MKSVLISEIVYNDYTAAFNTKMNKALMMIEEENGFIREKKYICRRMDASHVCHNLLIFYDIIPTRKVITEKSEQ